ncbi:MAG: hypothetical protein A2081_01270 [Elusimicrobia bacterium GWC2_61_19]|nr:MAG: hypothetical protein A2081_01270 [Elusimicrobia bacterium GWC2_61_19]
MKLQSKTLTLCSLLAFGPAFAFAQGSDDDILRDALWTRVASSKPSARPSVGLALSGGGARGFAHTGVLEALEYSGFPVDYVSGTSMGSVIGALYASGQPVDEIWGFGRNAANFKVSSDFKSIKMLRLLITDKLITPTYITRFIDEYLGSLTFEKLKKPFACTAMDMRTGEKIVFTDGPLAIAVRASVNLPGIFAPVQYRHRYLVDGGVVDFIPIDAARGLGADWVLASVTGSAPSKMPDSVLLSLLQVIDIRGSLLARESEKNADFVIKPEVGDISVAEFDRCMEAGEVGLVEASRRVRAAEETYLIFAAPRLVEKL